MRQKENISKIIQSPEHLAAAQYAIHLLKQSILLPFVDDVILYGSCARGEEQENSDVDLFVVFSNSVLQAPNYNELKRAMRYLRGNATQEEIDNPVEVDIHIVIGNEWTSSPEWYHQNIRKEGISVWD